MSNQIKNIVEEINCKGVDIDGVDIRIALRTLGYPLTKTYYRKRALEEFKAGNRSLASECRIIADAVENHTPMNHG